MRTIIIKNGNVYNPKMHTFSKEDLAVKDGKISKISDMEDTIVIDAEGCIVTPGLIDFHVHYFNHGTENGVNPDAASFPCGITTVVDAGSVGIANYESYRKSVMAQSDVRILNDILIASGGQVTDQYPERLEKCFFDESGIKRLFKKYQSNIVGIKTRMSRGILNEEDCEESLRETLRIADDIGCRVIVHITNPVMNLEKLVSMLRKGDIVCHVYQNKGNENILDKNGKMRKGILEARKRGILFDASNGRNNYDLEVCKKAIIEGFEPDIISSDMNTSGFYMQPLHSLPRILSKYMAMGMKLEDILDAATITPARLINREELAFIEEGSTADLAIFRIKEKTIFYKDMSGNSMEGNQVLVPQMTIKGGKIMYCQSDFC